VRALKDWFRANLTTPMAEVWQTLGRKLQGHYSYYNVNDNWRWVMQYHNVARRLGLKWIRRRSQAANMSWEEYFEYLERHPLVKPGKIVDLIAMSRGA
jgi:hypothetical protein